MRFTLPHYKRACLRVSSIQGFTLIELLVVFSIAVILSGSGYVALTSYSRKQALDQVVQDTKAAIDEAKFSAAAKTKPISCASSILTGFQFTLFCSQAGSPCTLDSYKVNPSCSSSNTPIVSKKLPSGISIDSTTTCSTITFNTLTGFDGTGCRIDFSGYGATKSIVVDNAGNASVQ